MDPKKSDLEKDANERAAKELGSSTIEYNNGKTKVKANGRILK